VGRDGGPRIGPKEETLKKKGRKRARAARRQTPFFFAPGSLGQGLAGGTTSYGPTAAFGETGTTQDGRSETLGPRK